MPFESAISPMTGNIATTVQDPFGVIPDTTIINLVNPWQVRVQWDLTGVASLFLPPDAQWKVDVIVESLGPGLEGSVLQAPFIKSVGATNITHIYDETLPVPANFPGLTPGAYKLVTVITLQTAAGIPLPVAAYQEGPVLQFYQS